MTIAGVVLAAGAGTRAGGPKALRVREDGEPWVAVAARALRDAGCSPVLVVLGAGAAEAAEVVPPWAEVVIAQAWAEGQSASLRAALAHAADATDALAVAVTLVDLPHQTSQAARRVIDAVAEHRTGLARAVYHGVPAHPVVIGRDHWDPLMISLAGDRGARDYLATHQALEVDCSDLHGGEDVDGA